MICTFTCMFCSSLFTCVINARRNRCTMPSEFLPAKILKGKQDLKRMFVEDLLDPVLLRRCAVAVANRYPHIVDRDIPITPPLIYLDAPLIGQNAIIQPRVQISLHKISFVIDFQLLLEHWIFRKRRSVQKGFNDRKVTKLNSLMRVSKASLVSRQTNNRF